MYVFDNIGSPVMNLLNFVVLTTRVYSLTCCIIHLLLTLQRIKSSGESPEDANDSGCLICVTHQALLDHMEKSINRSYQDDPDVNATIEKFLDTIEYILFFPINYGVNCMVNNGCQESSFADDEQTISSASFSTNVQSECR